jgi:hypothetical protein
VLPPVIEVRAVVFAVVQTVVAAAVLVGWLTRTMSPVGLVIWVC